MYEHISCIILYVYEYLCVFRFVYTYLYSVPKSPNISWISRADQTESKSPVSFCNFRNS